ncbi:hypothetical protein GF407_17270 [candidate division KSB1 bacterium]|nr:hypothetical protein [candidate division KSB1 bacterium]
MKRFCTIILLSVTALTAQPAADFRGQWELIPQASSEISLYSTLSLKFQNAEKGITIIQKWGGNRSFSDTLTLKTDGSTTKQIVPNRVWPTNVFMGLSMIPGDERSFSATWSENNRLLSVNYDYKIHGSQGIQPVSAVHEYELYEDNETLSYRIMRSTREEEPKIKYLFKRKGAKHAYVMELQDKWRIDGKLDEQAFLLSLQGIVNKKGPNLYFIYPENWPFNYTRPVFDYYKDKRFYTFHRLNSTEQAMKAFSDIPQGYVVWDKSVRTSLIVALTVSGLENAVIVSEELIPMAEKWGLKKVADFRGKFTGQSDAQIYQWAYDQYWDRCNKELIIWMGGVHGNQMQPGVADWGIYKEVFFQDLSSVPADTQEYELANRLLAEMKPMSLVMGWHSYAKDKERDHLKLTSSYGHVVEGLNTLPNFSFSHQIPFSHGFELKNNHHLDPGKPCEPKNKVYITCVQTDGLGIGSWHKPGRGEIPYAWEVIMNYYWLAPGMLEYFYSQATPNDYFIGCLSGPGYMYPKAVPKAYLPKLIDRANDLMQKLDLNVFEIMDYSEGATVEGNTELPKEIVDVYYEQMPTAIGFLNGYAPAFTFSVRNGRPLISYDYYLSPSRDQDDAVADLVELAEINSTRPYFLLMHVRESSDVKRVIGILENLPDEFELVPIDIFLTMAGKEPTFKERYLDD